MTTFGFNRTALRATQLKPLLMPTVFEDRISSRRADVVWPLLSCDLIPLDYYLWGAVKDKCYADKRNETIDALKDNIREAIQSIMCTDRVLLYSYSKFEVYIVFMLNNTHDVVVVDSY